MSYAGPPAPGYRQPQFRPACARCGADPGDTPLFSPQGHVLCRGCYHAVSQVAANQRAQSTLGGGLINLGGDAPLRAGMQNDIDAKLLRRCAKCKAPAVTVEHVTFHYVNGLTRGRTYRHRCAQCSATFKTESVLRVFVEVGAGLLCALFGAGAIFVAEGWVWLVVLLLPIGLAMAGLSVGRIVNRFLNPPVPRALGV